MTNSTAPYLHKVTVRTHPDIALIKYWGKKNKALRLPANGSLSVVLEALHTTTTVEFDLSLTADQVQIGGQVEAGEVSRASQHLQRVRELAKDKGLLNQDIFARVVSQNNFPTSTGLSSSSSGFAALSIAASRALGLELTERELSILARQGSGSACRCVCAGFVEWLDGNNSENSYAVSIAPPDLLPLRDLVVIVSEDKKQLSSSAGHDLAESSPFFVTRQERIGHKLVTLKQALLARDFGRLGELAEAEALEFHSILLTSQPSVLLLYPGTVAVMHLVHRLRKAGTPVFFTINTGFNIHVLTLAEHEQHVRQQLEQLSEVQQVIVSGVAGGPEMLNEHLF